MSLLVIHYLKPCVCALTGREKIDKKELIDSSSVLGRGKLEKNRKKKKTVCRIHKIDVALYGKRKKGKYSRHSSTWSSLGIFCGDEEF